MKKENTCVKSGPLRMHFQHSRAKIRVFVQSTDIIKFWFFYSVPVHEYSVQTGVIFKEKYVASSLQIAGKIHRPLALTENRWTYMLGTLNSHSKGSNSKCLDSRQAFLEHSFAVWKSSQPLLVSAENTIIFLKPLFGCCFM